MVKVYNIINKVLPLGTYTAMTIWPVIFINKKRQDKYTDRVERHEYIHVLQQIECLVIGCLLSILLFYLGCGWWSLLTLPLFFWIYILEWLIKLPFCLWSWNLAYYSVSFEQEAYDHQSEVFYNDVRKRFNWLKYLFKTI